MNSLTRNMYFYFTCILFLAMVKKSILREVQVPVNMVFNLFYAYVLFVWNYNSEAWVFINAVSIERVHKKFCKSVLNVKSSTNSFAIYGELGRFPLIIERRIQIVKYVLILHQIKQENCIVLCFNRST